MMRDMMGMMKQAQQLQQKMQELQAELDATEVEGASGGGLVKLRMTAKGDMRGLSVDPSLMVAQEREILEDLVVAAHADARSKAERMMAEKMQALTGGLPLPPGLKLF